MQRIAVKNIPEQAIGASNAPTQVIGVRNDHKVVIGADPYDGPYEVTPSAETQVLQTADRRATENIVVNPIPKNYGLITYNGYEITVS